MNFFVTGTAGFIGYHLAKRLLVDGHAVTGFDGMTPYYDVTLKHRRHALLEAHPGFTAIVGQLEDAQELKAAVVGAKADIVVHLAAQAGVRYSIEHPESYISSNLVGTANLLESVRSNVPRHLLFASTSSVYGGNLSVPFAERDRADGPVSLYAATKKGGEAMMHSYSHLWQIPTTCLRFFTVYGPWGRPDMALFKFVSAMERGDVIDVYGEGRMRRDFTFVDDLIEAIVRLVGLPPTATAVEAASGDSLSPVAPFRTVNIAGGNPVELMSFIEAIEAKVGRRAKKAMLPMQPGDVVQTMADPALLQALIGYVPETPLADGVSAFVDWYRAEYSQHRAGRDRSMGMRDA